MTRLEAANNRRAEAEAAMAAGDFAAAARDFTLAAEQLEAIWWEMHRSTKSPDAQNMRREASKANRMLRDRDEENGIGARFKMCRNADGGTYLQRA